MSELEMNNEAEPETEDFTADELSDEALDREFARMCVTTIPRCRASN